MVELMTWSPGLRQSRNRQIVAFGATAGEDDFRRPAPEQRRHRFPRTLHRCPRLLPMMMDGRRVAKVLREVRPHGLKNLRQHWRGRVIVEIDSAHGTPAFILRPRAPRVCEGGHFCPPPLTSVVGFGNLSARVLVSSDRSCPLYACTRAPAPHLATASRTAPSVAGTGGQCSRRGDGSGGCRRVVRSRGRSIR